MQRSMELLFVSRGGRDGFRFAWNSDEAKGREREVRKRENRDQTLCSSRILFCDWRRNRTGHMTEFACRQDKGTTRVHIVSDLRRTKPKFLVDQTKKLDRNQKIDLFKAL